MSKSERHARILSILGESDELSIHELTRRLGRVSSVTVRRDVTELAAEGALHRTHGTVSKPDSQTATHAATVGDSIQDQIGDVDAIILPPIEGRGADTLRGMARRRKIPFLAESAAQEGGIYLGPDNFSVGRELGHRAGRALAGRIAAARVLLVSLDRLPNTRSRCDGFIKGFRETFGSPVESWRVDGRGRFSAALSACLDAFAVHPDINVAFGVNDHSILAALEASDRRGIEAVHGFGVGGEGGSLFDVLQAGNKLHACAALFPEIVGLLAIDFLAKALAGEAMPAEIRTPHAILTPQNIARFYRREPNGWSLNPEAESDLISAPPAVLVDGRRRTIGFVPHYPAHDWYRNMARAMRMRCDALGFELRIAAPQAGIAREIKALRHLIARVAARRIHPGDTVILNGGETSLLLADEIAAAQDITVVTNSLEIMERLADRPRLKVILTSGEYHPKHRCLVGPSLGALFETLKVDKAFLSVDGITARFGLSAGDERLALAAKRFIDASREVFVLADQSVIGFDANHRIAPLRAVAEVITDFGSLPASRLALTAAGIAVTVADEEHEGTDTLRHSTLSSLRA
jgi:DeoR/GlpR family transcriptional regulator of sugar metabolism